MLEHLILIDQEHQKTRQNPPKEVHLLTALKPFTPPQNHQSLDTVIELLHLTETLKRIQKSLP